MHVYHSFYPPEVLVAGPIFLGDPDTTKHAPHALDSNWTISPPLHVPHERGPAPPEIVYPL